MKVEKVTDMDADFLADWDKQKKEHDKQRSKMREIWCVFRDIVQRK